MVKEIVVTGASGFLGKALLRKAASLWPQAKLRPINSPRQGGPDLESADASRKLDEAVRLTAPKRALLIHAAAVVERDGPRAILANAAMAANVAAWAERAGVGYAVLVSSVSVYPFLPREQAQDASPQTSYGLGKLAAELIWRSVLPQDRASIVRVAGILGWQEKPTLFWNRLLTTAARGSPPESLPVVTGGRCLRNFISAEEAGECILQAGFRRLAGPLMAAGSEVLDTRSFVEMVQKLPGSRLRVDWGGNDAADHLIYPASPEFKPYLKPLREILPRLWTQRPSWVLG